MLIHRSKPIARSTSSFRTLLPRYSIGRREVILSYILTSEMKDEGSKERRAFGVLASARASRTAEGGERDGMVTMASRAELNCAVRE